MEYELRVLVGGRDVTKYNHNGDVYLEGRPGSVYELELINNSSTEAEFVVSIDGLSIIDGKAAGVKSTGYIINAWGRSRIKGWLVDSGTAAEFKFGAKGKSYAAQSSHGDIQNAGVIGLKVYRKKVKPRLRTTHWDPVNQYGYHTKGLEWSGDGKLTSFLSGSSDNAQIMNMSTTRGMASYDSGEQARGITASYTSSVGTEFGDATKMDTRSVQFERSSDSPTYTQVMYYGDAKDLNRIGITLEWQKPAVKPNPFPGDYCEPPIGWQRK